MSVEIRRVLRIPVSLEFNDVDRDVESPWRTHERADILTKRLGSTFLHGSNHRGQIGGVPVRIDVDAIVVDRDQPSPSPAHSAAQAQIANLQRMLEEADSRVIAAETWRNTVAAIVDPNAAFADIPERLRDWKDRLRGFEPALLLTHLTPAEFEAFHAHHIPLTASTGPDTTEKEYPGTGAYIATALIYLPRALTALGWTKPSIHIHGNQWRVRR